MSGNIVKKKELISLPKNEVWLSIPDYKNYEVSSFGRVKSYNKGRIIIRKLVKEKSGYLSIGIYNKGIKRTFRVHKLVAMAFLGHVPDNMNQVVRHLDDNKLNNNVINLKTGTQRDNVHDMSIRGTSKYRGVCWSKRVKKWRANIMVNNKQTYLGTFKTEIRASIAYNFAELQINQLKQIA